jgi:hypothetical protein
MELAIQKLAAINLLIIGLSHIFQHRAWAEFFIRWREKGEVGVFYTALLHMPIGSLIVSFHNVWGWVLKGLLYFVYPKHGLRMLNRVTPERSWEFIIPGVIMVVYALALTYHIFRQ